MPKSTVRASLGRVKRRLQQSREPVVTKPVKRVGAATGPTDASRCLVCGSPKLTSERIVSAAKGRELDILLCENCRYVSLPGNHHDYAAATKTVDLGSGMGVRCATLDTPGRETGMAKLGLQVLGRKCTVMIYGAGQSLDVHHIAKLKRTSHIAIGDLVKLRDDAEFIDINNHATKQFDVVIASEVLEHFPSPRENFANLFSYVKDDGIIIAATNIRDALPMSRVQYVWFRGHVSYFSPQAIRLLARESGMHVDFRLPLTSTGQVGPRKRYVIFSRSQDVIDAVADWFGDHPYAPSEPPNSRRKTPQEVGHKPE